MVVNRAPELDTEQGGCSINTWIYGWSDRYEWVRWVTRWMMAGWMDDWKMVGWMDGWMTVQMDKGVGGLADELMCRWTDRKWTGRCMVQSSHLRRERMPTQHFPLTHEAQHKGHGLSCLMAAQPAIWFSQQGTCLHCPEARGRPWWGQGHEAGAWGLTLLPAPGERTLGPLQPQVARNFGFCFQVSVLKEASQEKKQGSCFLRGQRG